MNIAILLLVLEISLRSDEFRPDKKQYLLDELVAPRDTGTQILSPSRRNKVKE